MAQEHGETIWPVPVSLTAERISKLRPDDLVTLIHDGRITTHRVVSADVNTNSVELADRPDDGHGWMAELSYSGQIHEAGWDGNDA